MSKIKDKEKITKKDWRVYHDFIEDKKEPIKDKKVVDNSRNLATLGDIGKGRGGLGFREGIWVYIKNRESANLYLNTLRIATLYVYSNFALSPEPSFDDAVWFRYASIGDNRIPPGKVSMKSTDGTSYYMIPCFNLENAKLETQEWHQITKWDMEHLSISYQQDKSTKPSLHVKTLLETLNIANVEEVSEDSSSAFNLKIKINYFKLLQNQVSILERENKALKANIVKLVNDVDDLKVAMTKKGRF